MRKGEVTRQPDELGRVTDGEREELRALADLPDEQIDTSDIPPLSDEKLANMVRGRFYRPVKQQITARLDADVLAWLKSGGKGYQGRMNAILRREMLAQRRDTSSGVEH